MMKNRAAAFLALAILWPLGLRAKEEIIPSRNSARQRQGPKNPLHDVAGDMDLVARRLAKTKTDETTQETEQKIIEKLDRLIEQARQQSQCPPRGGTGQQREPQQQQQKQPRPAQQRQKKAQRPAATQQQKKKQTARPGIGRPGSGNPTGPIHTDAQEWGNLPPAIREQLLNIQGEGFPLKYRELLRRYYRALSRPRE